MTVPLIGERYRGVEGHIGFLLVQASNTLRAAMDTAMRPHDLTGPQYGALSVLARDPGLSGADLARATNITPQAINEVLAMLERKHLIERHPHPTHGRILQATLTDEGQRRLQAANPAARALSAALEEGFTADQIATVKTWLVEAAKRL
jgi:DNA-binding MarR family transcriptional regulator